MAAKELYFTSEWEDDDRMNFMFSAFPEHRHVNPKHWDSKLQFWRKIILESCHHHNELCVDFNILRRRFPRNGLFPLGLGTVIIEMLRAGELEAVENVAKTANGGWISWGFDVAKRTASWTVESLFWGSDLKRTVEDGLLMVVTDRLKETAQLVLQIHTKKVEHEATDYIVPWNVLKTRCHRDGLTLSDRDLDLVMCHLQRTKTVVIHVTQDGEKVVKFVHKNENKVYEVNEKDLGILRLKKTIASLTLQADKLSNNCESCNQRARDCSRKGLKTSAVGELRKKSVLQKTLDRTYGSLHTLEDLLHRIQQADTDKMIVETLKSGASALKAIQDGLAAKDIDNIMLEVEETLDDAEDIQQAIAQGNNVMDEGSTTDKFSYLTHDLEKELAELSVEADDFKTARTECAEEPQTHLQEAKVPRKWSPRKSTQAIPPSPEPPSSLQSETNIPTKEKVKKALRA